MKGILIGLILMLITSNVYAGLFTPIIRKLIIEPHYRLLYIQTLEGWIMGQGISFARDIDKLLIFNPSPDNTPGIANLMGLIIRLVQPFYILAITGIALYLAFLSGSPQGRSKAKAALERVIISMVAFTLSPQLLNLLLQLSQSLTTAVFNITGVEPITGILIGGFHGAWVVISWLTMPNFALGSNPWAYTLFFMAWFPYMYVSVRCIVLTLLEIVFPLSVFLYSFSYTRGLGRGLLEQTISWTVLQFFWALTLVALVLSAGPLQAAFVVNPTLGGTNTAWSLLNIPWLAKILTWGPIGMVLSPYTTQFMFLSVDIFTLMIGIVGYGMIAALPFILLSLLKGFLP